MTLHRFIVPIKNVNTFCTFLDGQLRPENPLPIVGHGEHAIDDEFGWVAWVADDGKVIGRTHLDATEGEGGFTSLAMPNGYQAACLQFHRQVLFVGGNCGLEVIGSFDLAAPEPRWTPLDVPEQFRRHGKRIDDLLIDGDRLIAVDDVIVPKYLLRYDVSDPRAPRLLDVRTLAPHSGNETIHSGAVGESWVAVLSRSLTMGGGFNFVALLDRTDLGEYACLSAPSDDEFTRTYSRGTSNDFRTWREIAFQGDALLIAAGKDGVGLLDVAAIPRPSHPMTTAGRLPFLARTPAHDQFREACQNALRYVRPAGPSIPVVRVQPVAGTRHFLAVVETKAGSDTVVMELP